MRAARGEKAHGDVAVGTADGEALVESLARVHRIAAQHRRIAVARRGDQPRLLLGGHLPRGLPLHVLVGVAVEFRDGKTLAHACLLAANLAAMVRGNRRARHASGAGEVCKIEGSSRYGSM